ncbi:hypothetical protein FYJ29_09840 [Bacteroidales bacterium Oil-RF-744-WCA-WT-10]|uniref:Uncharacterized protein n=1 Tax=Sodaliphilus pleomorphus TaxID=2606626 RepID=A0A6L5XER6_9BACT|nr:hypothetical protein [Sodaliphilus pleomorphus]
MPRNLTLSHTAPPRSSQELKPCCATCSTSKLSRDQCSFIVNVKNSKCHAVYARLQVSITNYISKKTCIK